METFLTILVSLVSAWGCYYFAKKRGRNPITWLIAGLIFGLFAPIALFLLPSRKKALATQAPIPLKLPQLNILQPDHAGKLWYFLDEEKTQFGPMSFDALSKAWTEGKVREQTFVWNEAMENWSQFQDVIKPAQSS